MDYAHEYILINQRAELLSDIQANKSVPTSEFENSTFQFIRNWLAGVKEFTIQTSGSTGSAKPITISRQQMIRSARRTIQALNLKINQAVLVCLNTQYIAGKMMLVRALEGQMKIMVQDPSADPFQNLNKNPFIDFMAVVPMQLQTIMRKPEYIERLNNVEAVIVGGSAVPEHLKKDLQNISCPIYATYGMTETISHIALQLLNTAKRSDYFHTLKGVKISLDERGCLVIEDEIINDPVTTNDLVELVGTSSFRWLGRFDNIINSGGIKVSPEKLELETEKIITTLNVKRNFFISGMPHDILGQQVVLLLEGDPLEAEIENEIIQMLGQRVSRHELPKQIKYIPRFSLTATGKIDRLKSIGR